MIKLFPFIIKRLLLIFLILLGFTTSVNAANFVLFKNPISGVSALAPSYWIMSKELIRENDISTLLRVFSPDAQMQLEVTINTNYLPVKTFSDLSQTQFDEYAMGMVNSHLAMFGNSKLIYFNKTANFNGIPSVIFIFNINQDDKDFHYYIHSFVYNNHLYSIKFINRVLGILTPEELKSIVHSVRI